MASVTLSEPAMLDQVIWRELQPAPKHQRELYAAALALNPHLLHLPPVLPAGTLVNLPPRPVSRPTSEPVEIVRIFG